MARRRRQAGGRRAAGPEDGRSWLRGVWYAAAAATSWSFGYTSMFNSDLWFHLAAGREIWQRRAIPAVDSWSFTAAGRPWHNHEWLADILFHAWAAAFGIEALVYWQWAVLIATFTVLFHLLQRLAGSRPVAWLLLLLALAVAAPFFDIRPHLYSLLGFVLLLELTLLRPPSWWVPALVLVWVNLHGGAVFGLLALGLLLAAWLAAPGEERDWRQALAAARRRLPRAVGIAVASGVAALVNPHGVAALLYPLRLAAAGSSASRTTLVEWLPPFAPGGIQSPVFPWAIAVAACAAATILGFGGRWRWRRRSWATLTLCGLTLAMALESRRFITLFAIASALLAAVAWRALRERLARLPRGVSGLEPLAAAAAVAFAVTRLLPYPQGTAAFLPLTRMDRLPVDTLDFAAANDLQGRVFNYFLWGGYLDYRTGGRLAVFLDPRSETVFADETQRRYMRVHFLRAGWEEVVRESAADFVLWPT
ncbi:MAG TPA: hypothetical protein VMT16_16345, partial [Thermoanaerobaculia bacterium]|nr:hypothetical protein [Thermoanaerobaculia bacterium]